MVLLPRPYNDEIIGSTLLRGCRQLGIQPKRFAPLLRGGSTSLPSPILPSCVGLIAQAAGLSSREILYGHTVFPYVTAFMDREKVAALEQEFLNIAPSNRRAFGPLQSKAVVPFLRICRQCIAEELELYGESYWHRSHLLPGVHVCLKHETELWETNLPPRGFFKMTLPHEAESSKYRVPLIEEVLTPIAQASNEILAQDHRWPTTTGLRKLAIEKNLCTGVYEIPASRIAADVLDFFGEPFLTEVRCSYAAAKRSPWPALVLRESSGDLAPLKYLLMGVYLKACSPLPSALTRESVGYERPGPKTSYQETDHLVVLVVKEHLDALAKLQERTTVKALLSQAGIWEQYRHNRKEFPKLATLVSQFRASDQSERQIGRRASWRRK